LEWTAWGGIPSERKTPQRKRGKRKGKPLKGGTTIRGHKSGVQINRAREGGELKVPGGLRDATREHFKKTNAGRERGGIGFRELTKSAASEPTLKVEHDYR